MLEEGPDRLKAQIYRLKSENEEDVPVTKRAERLELLEAVKMLDTMMGMHKEEDTVEVAQLRFETTGAGRNYQQEREDLVKFMDLLEKRLDQYFARR